MAKTRTRTQSRYIIQERLAGEADKPDTPVWADVKTRKLKDTADALKFLKKEHQEKGVFRVVAVRAEVEVHVTQQKLITFGAPKPENTKAKGKGAAPKDATDGPQNDET